MADWNRIGRALGGAAAGFGGTGPQYLAALQRGDLMREEEKDRERARQQKSTDRRQRLLDDFQAKAATQFMGVEQALKSGDAGYAASMLDQIINIPAIQNSPAWSAAIEIKEDLAREDLQTAMAKASSIAQAGRAMGVGREYQRMPASVQEWEYFNSLPEDKQQEFLNLQGAAYMNIDPEARGIMRVEDIRDVQELSTPEAMAAADRQRAVGSVETEQAIDRQSRLYDQERTQEVAADEPAARARADQAEFDVVRFDETLSQVRDLAMKPRTTGYLGARLRETEGSNAYNLASLMRPLRAFAGFERLQQMRDSSPTGGALGSVSERELMLLESAWAALDPNMDRELFLKELEKFEEQVDRSWNSVAKAYQETYGRPYSEANTPDGEITQPPQRGGNALNRAQGYLDGN